MQDESLNVQVEEAVDERGNSITNRTKEQIRDSKNIKEKQRLHEMEE
jgi:hypothetical protein